MDLLLIIDEEKQHYVYIKDFDRLMFSYSKNKKKKHFCKYCLQCFYSKEDFENHSGDCMVVNGTQKIAMPKEGSKVYFNNYDRQLPVPFVIYADFESIIKNVDTCIPADNKSYTHQYQKHEACGFGYKVVCHYDKKYSKEAVIYRGPDVVSKFITNMFDEVIDCQRVMFEQFNKPLKMTDIDEEDFQTAENCHICNRKYQEYEEENIPVRDHCHITGKYRGSAHRDCNLKLQISADKIRVPVIFHNLGNDPRKN